MTTIIYNHKNKQIAVDSRTQQGGRIVTDKAIKWKVVNGNTWFLCGDCADQDMIIEHYDLKETKDSVIPDSYAIVIDNKKAILFTVEADGVTNKLELSESEPLGSGGNWALSALDHGKTARQAVEYAKTRDCYTGGKVHVFDIRKNKFVRG